MILNDLFESATSELYHNTGVWSATKILENGYFQLTASAGTGSELLLHKPGKFYYLSTTRSKVGDYTLHNYYLDGVVLNLNGDWLNHRYKTSPVDYWERSWAEMKRTSEMEDRVFSSEPTIQLPSPATKLIKSIHVLFQIDKIDPQKDEDKFIRLRRLITAAKKLQIPLFLYAAPNAWLTQSPAKRIPLANVIKLMRVEKPEKPWTRMQRDYLKDYRELYFKSDMNKLSPSAKKRMWKVYQYPGETATSLEADIHNQRTKGDPGLIKLLQIFKKLKINSAKEYAKWLDEKWTKIIKASDN